MTDQEVIQAFPIMWDNFPEPVTITQRSREIIAVNKKAAELGLTMGRRARLMAFGHRLRNVRNGFFISA